MPKLPLEIVTRGNNMHGRPSQRPKAASFKKRAGLSRGTENREEVGEKGPASERSESEEGVRAPGSQYQISEKGPKQRGRRDGDGRTEAKSLLLLRERTLCILKEEGETEMERERASYGGCSFECHLRRRAAAVTLAAIGMLKSCHTG